MQTQAAPTAGPGAAASLALLGLRAVTGGLMIGHGSQKLFGAFGGYGLQGTAGWLESLGLKPGSRWATAAAASEFGGGVLTALGLLNPIGPVTMMAPMGMAIGTVHWGKPIWVTEGGAELPLTNIAAALALALAGPGALSLDRALGIRVPWWATALACAGAAAGLGFGLASREVAPSQPQEEAGAELQGGAGASASPAS